MAGENAVQHKPQTPSTTTPELIQQEQAPQPNSAPPIQQLQRLVGNQRTQQLLRHPQPSHALSPAQRRAPGLPPVRGVVQREDDEETTATATDETQTDADTAAPESTSSAAAALAAVPDSAVTLSERQIQHAIWYNRHRFAPQSVSALRRYFQQPEGTAVDTDLIRAIARYQQHFGLGQDGLIGGDTFDHIDLHQLLESTVSGTPLTDSDLIFSINVSKEGQRWDYDFMPGSTTRMRFRTVSRFSVEVMFPRHAHPEEFRYRQMIKGRFEAVHGSTTQDLATIFNTIPGTGQLPADYTEDGNSNWTSTGVYYGRRTDPGQPTATTTLAQNQYVDSGGQPDQRRGNRYLGTDGPKAIVDNLRPGTTLRLRMEFLGQVVRIASGEVMQQKAWTAFDFVDLVPETAFASGTD